MKKLLLGMVAVMMLVMSGCGGGTAEVAVPGGAVIQPPSITLSTFSQDRLAGFVDVSVDFFAPDADIDTMTVAVFDNSIGSERSRVTTALPGLHGLISGNIPFSIDYINFPIGTFTVSVFFTDIRGNFSNLVARTFSVP